MSVRRSVLYAVGTLIGVLLLAAFLRRSGDVADVFATIRGADAHWLLAGMALFGVSLFAGLTRWFCFLRGLRLPVRYRDALRLYAAGHFFNVIGPGSTGGDIAKAAWIAAKCPGRRAEAVMSIAADRIIGLLAMFAFVAAVCAAPTTEAIYAGDPMLAMLRHVVYAGCLCGVMGFILLGCVNLRRLEGKGRFAELFYRAWSTLRVCLLHPFEAGLAFALSILNLFTIVGCYFCFSRAIAIRVPFRSLMATTPLADTIASVPVTPGGAGLRENTLQTLLGFAGVDVTDATALALLMFGTILFWAVLAAGTMAFSLKRAKNA